MAHGTISKAVRNMLTLEIFITVRLARRRAFLMECCYAVQVLRRSLLAQAIRYNLLNIMVPVLMEMTLLINYGLGQE